MTVEHGLEAIAEALMVPLLCAVMGALSGGDIELRSGNDSYGCEGLLDFSFLVSEVP